MTTEQRATLRSLAIDLQQNCEEDPRWGIQAEAITSAISEIERLTKEREVMVKGIRDMEKMWRAMEEESSAVQRYFCEGMGKDWESAIQLLNTYQAPDATPVPASNPQAPSEDTAKRIVKRLVKDIKDRRGLGDEFEAIDADVMNGELLPKWERIISEEIGKAPAPEPTGPNAVAAGAEFNAPHMWLPSASDQDAMIPEEDKE